MSLAVTSSHRQAKHLPWRGSLAGGRHRDVGRLRRRRRERLRSDSARARDSSSPKPSACAASRPATAPERSASASAPCAGDLAGGVDARRAARRARTRRAGGRSAVRAPDCSQQRRGGRAAAGHDEQVAAEGVLALALAGARRAEHGALHVAAAARLDHGHRRAAAARRGASARSSGGRAAVVAQVGDRRQLDARVVERQRGLQAAVADGGHHRARRPGFTPYSAASRRAPPDSITPGRSLPGNSSGCSTEPVA